MSCIAKGNTRCTKCCDVIHISRVQYNKFKRGKIKLTDQELVFGKDKLWARISKRKAMKINPYMFSTSRSKEELVFVNKEAVFFTCKAKIEGVGCSIRDTDKHPNVCKIYTGGNEYSPTCGDDINIIARTN